MSYWRECLENILDKDPAARSRLEVALCYPGFHALILHNLAHPLWQAGWRTPARFISHISRVLTGIEIHPGATIGRRVFIDHGMGVVIGETAEVGDDTVIYQGVTLGAGAAAREGAKSRDTKRHPTLGQGVVVGSGAEIQGAIIVGDNVRVASRSIVLKDVPANSVVVGVPGRVIYQDGRKIARNEEVPDIEAEAIKALKLKLEEMDNLVKELRQKQHQQQKVIECLKTSLSGTQDALAEAAQSGTGWPGLPRDNGSDDAINDFLQGAGI